MKRCLKSAVAVAAALSLLMSTAAQAATADGLRDTAALESAVASASGASAGGDGTGLNLTTLDADAGTGLGQDELYAAAHYDTQQNSGHAGGARTDSAVADVASSHFDAGDVGKLLG